MDRGAPCAEVKGGAPDPAPAQPMMPHAPVAFGKSGCQAMLRKHPHLQARIAQTVEGQLSHGLFRSKFATNMRWQGSPVWECRVNEKSVGSVRVAFAVHEGSATVLFISPELQKRAFTAELERFLERGRA